MKLAVYCFLIVLVMLKIADEFNLRFSLLNMSGFRFEDLIYLVIFLFIVLFFCTFNLWDKTIRKKILTCIVVYCCFNVFLVLNNFGIMCIRRSHPSGEYKCFDTISKIRWTIDCILNDFRNETPLKNEELDFEKIAKLGSLKKEKLKKDFAPYRSGEQKKYDDIYLSMYLDSEPPTMKEYGCKYDYIGNIKQKGEYNIFCYKHLSSEVDTRKFLKYSDEYIRRYPQNFFNGHYDGESIVNIKRIINSYQGNPNIEHMSLNELLSHYRAPLSPFFALFFPFYLHPLRR